MSMTVTLSSTLLVGADRKPAINNANLVALEIPAGSVRKSTASEIAEYEAAREQSRLANNAPTDLGAADNDPENLWGEISVDGEIVAQIYKSGLVATKPGFELPYDPYDYTAAARAAQFLKEWGGSLEVANGKSSYYL